MACTCAHASIQSMVDGLYPEQQAALHLAFMYIKSQADLVSPTQFAIIFAQLCVCVCVCVFWLLKIVKVHHIKLLRPC